MICLFAGPHQLCPSADVHQGFSNQHEKLPGCPMFSTACQELLKWHIQAPRQRSCRNFDLDQGSQKLQVEIEAACKEKGELITTQLLKFSIKSYKTGILEVGGFGVFLLCFHHVAFMWLEGLEGTCCSSKGSLLPFNP